MPIILSQSRPQILYVLKCDIKSYFLKWLQNVKSGSHRIMTSSSAYIMCLCAVINENLIQLSEYHEIQLMAAEIYFTPFHLHF